MESSLLALLSQQIPSLQPTLQTRKGLIIVGLQNEFTSADGKLPVSVSDEFWPGLRSLVPAFREFGDVIWVRSEFDGTPEDSAIIGSSGNVEYEGECENDEDGSEHDALEEQCENDEERGDRDSPVPAKRQRVSFDGSDSTPTLDAIKALERPSTPEGSGSKASGPVIDDEFFLAQTSEREACCLKDSHGAELCADASTLFEKDLDLQITTNSYSAFGNTSLLTRLRCKLVTELFICGCPTNSLVYATAMDAARYGFRINLIEDCLAARSEKLNKMTIDQLCEVLEADAMTGAEALELLRNPLSENDYETDEEFDVNEQPRYGEVELEGLRGGGNIPVADDDSSVCAQSLADTAGDASPVLVSPRPLSSHLDNGLQDLHFKPINADNSCVTEDCRQEDASRTSESEPVSTCRQELDSTELEHSRPTEDRRNTEGNSTIPQTAKLEDTSASNDLANVESLADTDLHHFLQQRYHLKQTPTAASKYRGINALASLCRLDQGTVDQYEDMMKQARGPTARPLFGDGLEVESKGSSITYGLLPSEVADTVFDALSEEINWQKMYHQTGEVPRMVCCQSSIAEDGSRPVYRHPSDQTLPSEPWTPMVNRVRRAAEEQVGHPLNHALIQLYRSGTDYISEHSDKTLDITKGTYIINVSFGAQRIMRLRTKRVPNSTSEQAPAERTTYRVPMPHNSMIKMTLETNAEYLHGINADKRPAVELSPTELAYSGGRISLTFRNIGTYLDSDSTRIWGQGATGKTHDCAASVINGDAAESEKLVRAFGAENQATTLQWDGTYGAGSDVLHLKSLPVESSTS